MPGSGRDAEADALALYDAHAAEVLRYARRLARDTGLAEEAVQETFLRCYVELTRGDFLPSRAWLFRVTRNFLLDERKSYAARHGVSLEAIAHLDDCRQNPEAAYRCGELVRAWRGVLTRRERECLHLRVQGWRYREIGVRLQIQGGTVAALLARALGKLRRRMSGEDEPR